MIKEDAKAKARRSQVAHSWGILIGMSAIPILALMSKVFPRYDAVWEILFVVFGLLVARSVIGYLFPGASRGQKKAQQAATQAH